MSKRQLVEVVADNTPNVVSYIQNFECYMSKLSAYSPGHSQHCYLSKCLSDLSEMAEATLTKSEYDCFKRHVGTILGS